MDIDYLMVYFIEGQVKFVDDGKGSAAFTSDRDTNNNKVKRFGTALNTDSAMVAKNRMITSTDDKNYSGDGKTPEACFCKSKLNGLAEIDWSTTPIDWN